MDIGWTDLKKVLTDIVQLTSNVETLQIQLEEATRRVREQEREIADLRSDLRVARAELEGAAINAATSTVIQAHEGIIRRMVELERVVGSDTADINGTDAGRGGAIHKNPHIGLHKEEKSP